MARLVNTDFIAADGNCGAPVLWQAYLRLERRVVPPDAQRPSPALTLKLVPWRAMIRLPFGVDEEGLKVLAEQV